MLYFDYSATTFPNDKVIKEFDSASRNFIGNPNSSHRLGMLAKARIDTASINIANILKVKPSEIIYTSGSSESNNLAIKGVCLANTGKHIITTYLEHSSVVAPINRLCQQGYEVSFVKLTQDGLIDIEHLKSLIRPDTVLVSIAAVDSELGIRQNIEEIGLLLKGYNNIHFHVDATQIIGKDKIDFSNVDLFSFSAHKFFGIKGIGCLVKKENIRMMPQIDGGSSTTKYRSGTPALELIASLEKALILAYENFNKKIEYVNSLNKELRIFLSKYKNIKINSTSRSIGQILNFSIPDSNKFIDLLQSCGVYISTKSACSNKNSPSNSVMAIYNDRLRAQNTVRISLSYVTTDREIKELEKIFETCYIKLGDEIENNKI